MTTEQGRERLHAEFDEYWEAYRPFLLSRKENYSTEEVFELTKDAARHAYCCGYLSGSEETERT